MDKVLVTGGTGFVGSWMKKTQPDNLSCTHMSKQDYLHDDVSRIEWRYIIHLAPVAPYSMIRIAKRCNARLLYCSSGIVYHPENNIEYRRNKLNWEQYCLDSGVDVVIARLFTFYGDHLDEHKAYTQFTKAAKANKLIEIWGDGNTVRSYMSGEEMGRWLWSILLHGARGEAYDVGDDNPVTMLQLAKFIKSQYNSKSEIIIKGGVDPVPHYLPVDTAKTKALLEKEKS
jgi:nucleoside-diphosphate-sugar epimerase